MLERLLRLAHHVPVVLAHLSALLAHGLAHGLPLSGAVDELDLALALRILVPVEDPDVGPDSCAVEHAVRQRDDHIDEVFFEQPLADRIRALVTRDRKSTRLNPCHSCASRMPSYACKIKRTNI